MGRERRKEEERRGDNRGIERKNLQKERFDEPEPKGKNAPFLFYEKEAVVEYYLFTVDNIRPIIGGYFT